MKKSVETIKREAHIRMMHKDIMSLGDERVEEVWLLVYPDGADEYDIEDMAEDDEQYADLCKTHAHLMKRYGQAAPTDTIADEAEADMPSAKSSSPWWADNDIHDHIINAGLKAMIAEWCGFKPEAVNLLESSERDGFPTFVRFEVAGQGYYVDVETWEFGIDSSYYDRIFKCQCNFCK